LACLIGKRPEGGTADEYLRTDEAFTGYGLDRSGDSALLRRNHVDKTEVRQE
jgi:hypothetical protein